MFAPMHNSIRPFRKADLARYRKHIQKAQREMVAYFDIPGYAEQLEDGASFTLEAAGVPVASAGVTPIWEGRAFAWALLSDDAGRHMLALTRAVARYLAICPFRRLEAYVAPDFAAGHRWIEMLGFQCEGRMRAFNPEGDDALMYARVEGK